MTKVCLMCGDTYPDTTTFCAKDGSALRAAVQGDSLIGEVFCDRYVVIDMLGEGGMGAVYAARDVRLPQQVAIKVLREQGMNDPTIVARFRQEAESASRINHDRVARVTDFGFMNDGRAYLVMEYVGGRTLKQVVADRGVFDVAETSRIVTMVAEGLDAAHRLGIVHRDLKPDNVMILDDAGGGVRVKVLDFGIAKQLHASEESAGQTKTGFVIGTPQWMSPEQILGEQLDGRSDVYSLALLAYMMLTGQRAFTGASTEAEMLARLSSEPRTLHDLSPAASFPTGLQELLNRTLARNVNDRPSGALAFAKEFANIATSAGNAAATRSDLRAPGFQAAPFAEATSAPDARTVTPSLAPPAFSSVQLNGTPSHTSAVRSGEEQRRSKSSTVVVGTLAVAAIAAIAFFVVHQFGTGDSQTKNGIVASAPGASAASGDSANRISTAPITPPTTQTPPVDVPPAGSSSAAVVPAITPPPATSNAANKAPTTAGSTAPSTAPSTAATNPRASDVASRTGSPSRGAGSATVPPRDSAKVSANGGAVAGASSPQRSGAGGNAASIELKHLMDLADVDFADKDLFEINARIRRFESLLPELASSTDKGNAHLYIAMSHNAMGDNVKACASLNVAGSFAAQSLALRTNVEQWQALLKCGQ